MKNLSIFIAVGIMTLPLLINASDKKDEKQFNPLDLISVKEIWFDIIKRYTVGHIALKEATMRTLQAPARIWSLAWHPDGNMFASGGADKKVTLWNAKTHAAIHTLQGHISTISSIDFNPSGDLLLSADDEDDMRLWNTQSGEQLHSWKHNHLESDDYRCWCRRAVFDRRGERIASVGDKVYIWDVKTQKLTDDIALSSDIIDLTDLLWLHDPNILIVSSEEQCIHMLDIRDKRTMALGACRTWYGGPQIACTSDDNLLLWPLGSKIVVWDRKANKQERSIEDSTGNCFWSVQLSNDEQSVVTTQDDHSVSIWNSRDGNLQESMRFEGSLRSAQWSPDEMDLLVVPHSNFIYHLKQPEPELFTYLESLPRKNASSLKGQKGD
jgi:WD40 repeat protein